MSELANPIHGPKLAAKLRAFTPARVALGRTGVSLETRDLLDFQRAHALARDAVHARLECGALAAALGEITLTEVLRLRSLATDRTTYLQRPDFGRKLDEGSRKLVERTAHGNRWELALIVADGLSALAVERHAVCVIQELLPPLFGWRIAPVCVVEQGRVAIGDEIGAALGAEIAVVLIGERPGLSSPDSLGAYITWSPQPGRTDAERNCISNIRVEGLQPDDAARQICALLNEARRQRLTGVKLKIGANLIGKAER